MDEYINVRVWRDQGSRSCHKCARFWDLNDPDDKNDYFYWHDCEVQ